MNFQTPATTIMEKIVDLHHDIMFFLILIVTIVSIILFHIINDGTVFNRQPMREAFSHHTALEKI